MRCINLKLRTSKNPWYFIVLILLLQPLPMEGLQIVSKIMAKDFISWAYSNPVEPQKSIKEEYLISGSNHNKNQTKSTPRLDTFNTVLFKVTSPNNNKVSYLFGTHHAFGQTFFDSLTNANHALEMCELMIKENLNIPGHLAEDIINSRTSQTKWHKYLKKEDVLFVQKLFASSPTDFNKMTPTEMYAFLNRHFKQQVCLANDPADSSLSLDDYIAYKARQREIESIGLETTEEQIELINKDAEGIPKRNHQRRLSNIIHKLKTKNNNDCAETAWNSQMQMDYQLNSPCENTLILTARNNKWMNTIVELVESKNCFIAVGLSHLMYECGLINQLKGLGYTITPMNVK